MVLRDAVWLRVCGNERLRCRQNARCASKTCVEGVLSTIWVSYDEVLNSGRRRKTERIDALIVVARYKNVGTLCGHLVDKTVGLGEGGTGTGLSHPRGHRSAHRLMLRATRAVRLAEHLQTLPGLSRQDLRARWEALYGRAPPPRISRSLMIRAAAYKMQERAYGGLSAATRRALAGERPAPAAMAPREARPGTVLLREWHGSTHHVTIIEDGVVYRGKRYRSLSEVARLITGSRWSGPTFFGLNAMGSRRPHDEA
jgi:hypothetical protein